MPNDGAPQQEDHNTTTQQGMNAISGFVLREKEKKKEAKANFFQILGGPTGTGD